MVEQTITGTAAPAAAPVVTHGHPVNLLKVLGPVHVWALGVGIVLVGEFMGWNFAVGKGGALGGADRLLDRRPALHLRRHDRFRGDLDGRRRRRPVRAGQAHRRAADGLQCRPLPRHGLHHAGGGQRASPSATSSFSGAASTGFAGLDPKPFIVLTIVFLAWLNYRGVLMTLTFNLVITAIAFLAIIVLFLGVSPWHPGTVLRHADLLTDLPYGWIGVLAALHFGLWYYLGIEGTSQAAEEVRSPAARCRSARWPA